MVKAIVRYKSGRVFTGTFDDVRKAAEWVDMFCNSECVEKRYWIVKDNQKQKDEKEALE